MLPSALERDAQRSLRPSLEPGNGLTLPRSRRRAWWALHPALGGLLAVDLFAPPSGPLGVGLLALISSLVLPWAWWVVRGNAPGQSTRSFAGSIVRALLSTLALVLLAAKWWIAIAVPAEQIEAHAGSSRGYAIGLLVILGLEALRTPQLIAKLSNVVVDHPARLIMLSFASSGVLGAFALSLPVSLQRVNELSVLDNLFTAFSAVCVTGLAVNVISHTYSWVGQMILCLLIQIGGLGIMVLSAAVAVVTGQRMRIKRTAVLAEIVDTESLAHLRKLVITIVASTLLIEATAATLLYVQFSSDPAFFVTAAGASAAFGPWWAAVFHAVSGFCNAGFSTFDTGLVPYVGKAGVLCTLMLLIVAGGIGFPVLYELAQRFSRVLRRRRRERMSLHSRVALRATALLLVAMAVAYFSLEWGRGLAQLPWLDRALAAMFQSVSSRSAGFNVVDLGSFGAPAITLTCVAMFIGACPGSTGGGVKTTTIASLFAGLRSELQSRPAYLLDRALPAATIRKAIGVSFLAMGIVSIAIFLLLLVEDQPPLDLIFEVFSAFSTTGLSTGVTPRLSPGGKVIIILTMFVGRIGPLTLALAIARKAEPTRVELPPERVLIG